MKYLTLSAALALTLGAGPVAAQQQSVRVQPGQVCADNKCVRFSRDLEKVSMAGRVPVSVKSYGLRQNPVISLDDFRRLFHLALVQSGINDDRG